MEDFIFNGMSFSEWCYESNIEREYELLHDEYGDMMPLLSDFKEARYQEYVEGYKMMHRAWEKYQE